MATKPQIRPEIERTLDELRTHIRDAVRAEQLIDQLTQLGNEAALNEWLQSNIDNGTKFWLAFVEIDRFKSVNDEFGYESANELLRRVAGQLKNAVVAGSSPKWPDPATLVAACARVEAPPRG